MLPRPTARPDSDTGGMAGAGRRKDDEAALMFGRCSARMRIAHRDAWSSLEPQLGYERGDDEAATAFYLDLIEAAAGSGDAATACWLRQRLCVCRDS